jgi:hypothetical protein
LFYSSLTELRAKYGPVYVTRFFKYDIPWKPLSIGDFVKYDQEIRSGQKPSFVLEEEIFSKCVLDKSFIEDQTLDAGIVPTVAQHIMMVSGPLGIEEFNDNLQEVRASSSSAIYEMIILICRAFPAYTPEVLLDLSYEEFLIRLVLAESTLLNAGVIKEPIRLITKTESLAPKGKPIPNELKAAWQAQQRDRAVAGQVSAEEIIENLTRNPAPINFKEESMQQAEGGSGWDKADMDIERVKMVQGAQDIYKDILGKLPKKGR